MDRRSLPDHCLTAGEEYLNALRRLHFEPDGLMWAWDETVGEFVLVLVSAHFDHAGPLAMYALLTKAYNAAATPQEVSPFMVRLHSPAQYVVGELRKAYGWDIHVDRVAPEHPAGLDVYVTLRAGDLVFEREWVYFLRAPAKVHPAARSRQWGRFKDRVEKLAA